MLSITDAIIEAYNKGYSQHMIAKVSGISQPAVFWDYQEDGITVLALPLFL